VRAAVPTPPAARGAQPSRPSYQWWRFAAPISNSDSPGPFPSERVISWILRWFARRGGQSAA
jgi:hypothetical protein